MRSNVNLSQIARVAGCCAVSKLICCGAARIVARIARDAAEALPIEVHRTLVPVLRKLRSEGFQLVGLEQTAGSRDLHQFRFRRETVLVVGNERLGLPDDVLQLLDHAVEIPVYGMPHSYNVAMAASMALYEFCRQFPNG
jgi:tRNA G18 (ribose-2'-O)-methylase SpoU